MNGADLMYPLLFGVRRSARYHVKRRQFFDQVIDGCAALCLLSWIGAYLIGATFVGVFGLGLIFSGVWALAFARANRMMVLHADLAKAFIGLEMRIVAASDSEYVSLNQARLSLEASEPPPLRVLDVVCHNELCIAIGADGSITVTDWTFAGDSAAATNRRGSFPHIR